ncbi:MAG: hypothetical protein ACTSU5_14440 [Promethearchaeota archaeon]
MREEAEDGMEAPAKGAGLSVVIDKKQRYGFVDQFRGITIFLFVIADITWVWSGDIAGSGRLPVGPTWLNHGWKFYDFPAKQLITLIDIGQLLFVFVMGLMIPLSWKRHVERGGTKTAIGQLLVRLGFFYLIAGVMADFDPKGMFLTNTFAVLAAAMIVATAAAAAVKDPDKRFYLNLGLLVLLGVLYAIPGVRAAEQSVFGVDDDIEIIPLNLLGASVTAIMGGVVMEWFVNAEDKKALIREKVLPLGMFSWIACFCVDYFYWADHKAMNASLVLMTVGTGAFLFVIFWVFEDQFQFQAPGLNQFGRNTLLAFILALPFQTILWDVLDLPGTYRNAPAPWNHVIGFVSVVAMLALYYAVLVPLDRKGWYFTPSVFIRLFQAKKARE